jgi:hypothetical protein
MKPAEIEAIDVLVLRDDGNCMHPSHHLAGGTGQALKFRGETLMLALIDARQCHATG